MATFNGTIEIRENPVTSAKTYSRTFERSAGGKDSGYSDLEFSHRADGGYYRARFMIKGPRAEMSEFMQDGLGREVVIVGNDGKHIWEGYVHKMEYDAGRVAYSADLGALSNSVWLRYRVRGSSTTSRSTTQTDANSIANYGTKQFILSGGELESSAVADSIAKQYLNNHKAPSGAPTRIDPEKELAEFPTISIECRGWFDTLNWTVYNQTTSTDNQGASGQIEDILPSLPNASGGTESTSGDYKIHTFTANGTLSFSRGGSVEYLVVAGGGGGGSGDGGGGGAGGMLASTDFAVTAGTSYAITVGSGGAGGVHGAASSDFAVGTNGGNSVFATITATGGGGGGSGSAGVIGGSGGGGSAGAGSTNAGAAGTAGQGSAGGNADFAATNYPGGGGGGKSAVGGNSTATVAGTGGAGLASSISGSSVTYAGGGGGGTYNGGTAGGGGAGGGGGGSNNSAVNGTAGTSNTGGGGGGGARNVTGAINSNGGNGGSGIVIVRYLSTSIVDQFVKSTHIQPNATLVSKEYDADRRGGDIISDIARLGDSTNSRWIAYMDDDRAFHFEPAAPAVEQ